MHLPHYAHDVWRRDGTAGLPAALRLQVRDVLQ